MSVPQLWHTLRHPDGSWQPFGNVNAQSGGGPDGFLDVANADAGGLELHLVAVGDDRNLWHTTRFNNGRWQPMLGLVETQSALPQTVLFSNVACAGSAAELHVCAASNFDLWHTIRHLDGSWQSRFKAIESRIDLVEILDVACASTDGTLVVAVVTSAGQPWYTTRRADGTWDDHFVLMTDHSSAPTEFRRIACADLGGAVHFAATGADGRLWHTIRFADGTWQPAFGSIDAQSAGGAPGFWDVACGTADGEQLQVTVVGGDDRLWHTVRFSGGSWQRFFRQIESLSGGAPGGFLRVGSAGSASNLHVTGISND